MIAARNTWIDVTSGVPHAWPGVCARPPNCCLYCMHVNDITDGIQSRLEMFADE